jgi:hypothetical protein
MTQKLVTCRQCGWVHMGVSRQQVSTWGEDASRFERCFRCGGSHRNMRAAGDKDVPVGCTIQPVIVEQA